MTGTLRCTTRYKSEMLFTYLATLTPVGGDVTDDIQLTGASDLIQFNNVLKQVIVKATSAANEFNFGIFDKSDDFPLWTKSGNIGYFNDANEVLACLEGEVYFKIDSASINEAIKVRLIYAAK